MACGYPTLTHQRAGLMLLTWHCFAQLHLILLHLFTYSRGLACLLPGVTLVAEHNVGALAALPCLLQDWALHGKKMHSSSLFCQGTAGILWRVCAGLNTASFTVVESFLVVCYSRYWPSNSCCCFPVASSLNVEYARIHSSSCSFFA